MTIEELHNIFIRECGGRVTTDSRSIKGGELFVALKGENFDGNEFAAKALELGACYCLVTEGSPAASSGDSRMCVFPDTLKALWALAAYHRENTLNGSVRIPMLALTGTNGKTTTKELIKAVLATRYRLTATEGNLNNNIGVPLTLLRMTPETEMAVVEMGASHPGDINELVAIAHPDYGLITNVGRAHLLGFGSFEGVKHTKGEMYDYIRGVRGTCFVNTSSPDLCAMVEERPGMQVIPYGRDIQDATVKEMTPDEPFLRMSIRVDGKRHDISTRLVGTYNADNVLAAIAVGREFGICTEDAIAAVEAYTPANNRSQMLHTAKNMLVLDAYNANPSSMSAAIANFANIQSDCKILCLGDMLELGNESVAEHSKILKQALELNPQRIVLVGKEFAKAFEQHRELYGPDRTEGASPVECFGTSDEAADRIGREAPENCCILVKGSRGVRMEKLAAVL